MFYNVQQQALICFIPHTVIISTYTADLMVSARPVQGLLREELRMRLVRLVESLWCGCPGARLIHRTITARKASIITIITT